MTTRLGTIIITSMFILLNVAKADVKPFVGVGGVGQVAFRYWNPEDVFDADNLEPPVFFTGLHFETGLKWKRNELYAAYRTTGSQVVNNSYQTQIEEFPDGNNYCYHNRNFATEKSWAGKHLLLGMRHRILSEESTIIPIIGIAVDIGERVLSWNRTEYDRYKTMYYHDSGQYLGSDYQDDNYYISQTSFRILNLDGQLEVGVEWQFERHASVLALTQFGITIVDNENWTPNDPVFSVSQLFQLRCTL